VFGLHRIAMQQHPHQNLLAGWLKRGISGCE
jgi:hypothetical protein